MVQTLAVHPKGYPNCPTPNEGRSVSIHTEAGHIINATENYYGGVRLIIECDEGVCEPFEFSMNKDQWVALVAQGFKVLG